MRRITNKGFTLIELMIVISIIGTLSIVLVPKVGAIKNQAKINAVESNVYIVRSYLENRSGKDANSYTASTLSGQTSANAISAIQQNIGADMASNFVGSNALTNSFTNAASINYSNSDVTSDSPAAASVVIGYDSTGTAALPADNNSVSAALPKGVNFSGDVVVMVYSTGYVIYGVDNLGQMLSINILKFPQIVVGNPGAGGNPGGVNNSSVLANTNQVITLFKSLVIYRILNWAPVGQLYGNMEAPMYNDVYNKYTPGTANHLVNPYFSNVDTIGDANNYVDPNKTYSVIVDPQPSNYSIEDTKYSSRPGTVIAYYSTNPIGYVVYGVDQNGNTVGKTPINLSTEVTATMTQTLAANVASVYNNLMSNVNSNLNAAGGNQKNLASSALNQLQSLSLGNAYLPAWTNKIMTTSTGYTSGCSVAIGYYGGVANYYDYKGCVVVQVLSDSSGYEVFGVDYLGNKYGDSKVQAH